MQIYWHKNINVRKTEDKHAVRYISFYIRKSCYKPDSTPFIYHNLTKIPPVCFLFCIQNVFCMYIYFFLGICLYDVVCLVENIEYLWNKKHFFITSTLPSLFNTIIAYTFVLLSTFFIKLYASVASPYSMQVWDEYALHYLRLRILGTF